MFGLFKPARVHDAQLGALTRSRGLWRGTISLDSSVGVPLALAGGRAEPDAPALALAREMAAQFPSWRPAIAAALFEHYAPYAEAVTAGELPPDGGVPAIDTPEQVWHHVAISHVAITPLDGVLTTEIAYHTAWDEEHTLAARFQSGRLVELCGSVLAP
jgi:hypothetical protein